MAKREVHSHKKQASDRDDDRLLTEAQITDREFLESVYGQKLQVYAKTLCKGRTYGGDGPDDLVQHAIGKVVDGKEKWKGHTVKSFGGRLCIIIKHAFIDLERKHGLERHGELEEVDTAARTMGPAKAMVQKVDHDSLLRYLKGKVQNVKGEHKCIDLMFAGYTVEEMVEELGMSVDRVKKMRAQIFAAMRYVTTPHMIRVNE